MKNIIKMMQRRKILTTIPVLFLFIAGLNRVIYYNRLLGSCNIVNKWIVFVAVTGGLAIGLIDAIVMNIKKTSDIVEDE